jgi:fatty acid amide hydrolase 2
MNGVFGHKPTPELVSTRGCDLRNGTEAGTMLCAGPIVRHARDLRAIFKVLVGPEQVISLKLNDPVDVKKLKYYYCLDNNDIVCSRISPEIIKKIEDVAQHFTNISNKKVELVRIKHANKTSRIWRYWMYEEPTELPILMGNGKEVNVKWEIFKKFTGQSDLTLGAIYVLADSLLPPEDAEKIKLYTKEASEHIIELLGDDGILFYPSTTSPPPFHYVPFVQIFNFHYWSFLNALRLPSTQVPLGLNGDGVPLGIQVVSTKKNDRLCLAVAEELERKFGGWVEPFNVVGK